MNEKKAELLDGFMKNTTPENCVENFKVLLPKYKELERAELEPQYPIPYSPQYNLWRHLNERYKLSLMEAEINEIVHLAKLIHNEKITA